MHVAIVAPLPLPSICNNQATTQTQKEHSIASGNQLRPRRVLSAGLPTSKLLIQCLLSWHHLPLAIDGICSI